MYTSLQNKGCGYPSCHTRNGKPRALLTVPLHNPPHERAQQIYNRVKIQGSFDNHTTVAPLALAILLSPHMRLAPGILGHCQIPSQHAPLVHWPWCDSQPRRAPLAPLSKSLLDGSGVASPHHCISARWQKCFMRGKTWPVGPTRRWQKCSVHGNAVRHGAPQHGAP